MTNACWWVRWSGPASSPATLGLGIDEFTDPSSVSGQGSKMTSKSKFVHPDELDAPEWGMTSPPDPEKKYEKIRIAKSTRFLMVIAVPFLS